MSTEQIGHAGPVLKGMKALVTGIANEHSIAYGCAKVFRELGADLAITYATEKTKAWVEPLAQELEAELFMRLDVAEANQLDAVFAGIGQRWGASRHRAAFHCVGTEGRSSGRTVTLLERRLCTRDGHFVPFLRAYGLACRAPHGQGRHAAHHELSRRQQGRAELQHHGGP